MAFIPSDPDAVVPPTGSTGVRPGDVCPQQWEEDFERAAMTTEVLIARQLPANIPDLPYNYVTTTTAPPASGQVRLNATLGVATRMYAHRTASSGADVSTWLGYLTPDSSLTFAVAGDPPTSRGYRVTGPPIAHASYYEIPILWTEGDGAVPAGGVLVTLRPLAEPPDLYIDALGRDLYGHETMTRTDLINTSKDLLPTLADRILEVRGVNSVPRVEAVTIDARTGKFPNQNMELMSSAAPEKPSRYHLRLAVDERPIFDRMMFVAAVRHFISRDEWTLRISLDIAEWAAQL